MRITPHKRAETVIISGLLLAIAVSFVYAGISTHCKSTAAQALFWHGIATAIVWGVSLLHQRTRRLAAEERLTLEEAERLRKEQGQARLFDSDSFDSGIAQTRLREMERYGANLGSLIILALLGGMGAWLLYSNVTAELFTGPNSGLGSPISAEFGNTVLAGTLGILAAFLSFGIGKYAAGLSRDQNAVLLRAGAGHMVMLSGLGFLYALSAVFAYFSILWPEKSLGILIPLVMVLIAVEMVANFILDYYRPRMPGELPRPAYDGRLTGILAEQEGIAKTFAHTLDYQFGFKVSETWFFQFLNRAIAPLILFQLGTLYLLSTVVIVKQGELAVIERWGRPRHVEQLPPLSSESEWDSLETPLTPGFYLKWPWPVEVVRKVPYLRLQQIWAGSPQEGHDEGREKFQNVKAITWDQEHTKGEFNYIMPFVSADGDSSVENPSKQQGVDAMFIAGGISILYHVGRPVADGNPEDIRVGDIYRYLYNYRDTREMLISLSEREITSHFSGSNFWTVLLENSIQVEQQLLKRIQRAADEHKTGIQIDFVSLWNIHPPVGEVGKAYQQVVGAREERQAMIHGARAEAIAKPLEAEAKSSALLNQARAYTYTRSELTKAQAERFKNQLRAHAAAPGVYLKREQMQAIEESLASTRRLTILSPDITVVMDDKQAITASSVGAALNQELKKENP